MPDERIEPYAAAVRKLLKGVVYHDDPAWNQIRDHETPIRDYLARIGLGMHLDEIGSFAYLYDQSRNEDQPGALPPLTLRRSLSFPDTLLLVLLRERMDEHEMRDLDGVSLLLSEQDMNEMLSVFMGDHPDVRRLEQNISASVNRLRKYGFLTQRQDGRYEVRPILRAKINADEMTMLKSKLASHLQPETDMEEDDREFI